VARHPQRLTVLGRDNEAEILARMGWGPAATIGVTSSNAVLANLGASSGMFPLAVWLKQIEPQYDS
jgi:hypothetical protein